MSKLRAWSAWLLVMGLSCGGNSDETPGEETGNGSGTSPTSGRCAPAQAAQSCSTVSCAFDPSALNCATACQNIARTCAAGTCGTQCAGLNQDTSLCAVACETTKVFSCSNLSFGCWAMSDDCIAVGTCVLTNL